MNQIQLYKSVSKFLANRKYVFTRIKNDPKKQQIIIDAEKHLHFLKVQEPSQFKNICKHFASNYIAPLIPSHNSSMYQHANSLYNQLINQ